MTVTVEIPLPDESAIVSAVLWHLPSVLFEQVRDEHAPDAQIAEYETSGDRTVRHFRAQIDGRAVEVYETAAVKPRTTAVVIG